MTEDELKIKELTSKLAAMKETLNAEAETLRQKNNELEKQNTYLVSGTNKYSVYFCNIWYFTVIELYFFLQKELEVEKKKLLQEIKQQDVERNNLKTKLAKPNLQDQQVLEQGKYVW